MQRIMKTNVGKNYFVKTYKNIMIINNVQPKRANEVRKGMVKHTFID